MTLATTDTIATTAHSPRRKAQRPGLAARLLAAWERHAVRRSRRGAIEALEAKSDAELARMGLRRADIPYHVFRDLFYI